MRKISFKGILAAAAAVFAGVCALSIPASAYSAGIDDRAGLYTQSEREELEARQEQVAELTGWNIAVVTTDIGMGEVGVRAMKYAQDYYDETFGSDSSSVVYLIDLDYRFISMDGDVLNYFNTSRFDTMFKECQSRYMDYDDVGNLETFYNYLVYYHDEGTVPYDSNMGAKGPGYKPSDSVNSFNFGVGLMVGFIPAALAIIIIVSRYKYHHAAPPNCYLNGNSINMYRRQDRFVREYTTRTRIESSSGSSGGGGGGGGISHGGSSHGGGGGGGRR